MKKEEILKNIEDQLLKAKQAEENGDAFASAIYYKEVVALFKDNGQPEEIKKYTKKMIEMNKKAMDGFHKFEFSQHLPQEKIDEFLKPFLEAKDDLELLKLIGAHSCFNIEISKVKKMPATVASQICSLSAFDKDGNLVKGGSDNASHDFVRNYNISQGIANTFLQILLQKLILDDKLHKEKIISFIKKKIDLKPSILAVIQQGIERFFEQDYISSLHVLVPQFDRFFIEFSKMLGIETTVLNRSPKGTREVSTQSIFLSENLLNKKDIREKWGDDFCEQVNFVFCSPRGYQIRHKFAHGNISEEDCDFKSAALVLWFFITTFTRLQIKP